MVVRHELKKRRWSPLFIIKRYYLIQSILSVIKMYDCPVTPLPQRHIIQQSDYSPQSLLVSRNKVSLAPRLDEPYIFERLGCNWDRSHRPSVSRSIEMKQLNDQQIKTGKEYKYLTD